MSQRKIVNIQIEKLRNEHLHLTQEEFAERLGLERKKGRSTVNNWEQGAVQVKSDDLRNIGATFNVSVDYLLGLAQFPTVEPDIRAAQKITHLSEKAVANIQRLNSVDLLTRLLENDDFIQLLDDVSALEGRTASVKSDCSYIKELEAQQAVIGKPKVISTMDDLSDPVEQEKKRLQVEISSNYNSLYTEYALFRVAIQDIETAFSKVLSCIADTSTTVEEGKRLLRKRGL